MRTTWIFSRTWRTWSTPSAASLSWCRADTGVVVADRDDQNTMETLAGLERPLITFGLEEGDVHAAGLEWVNGFPSFDIVFRGEKVTRGGAPGAGGAQRAQRPGRRRRRAGPAGAVRGIGRGWAPSGERAAALSTRGHTGGRRSMTTTPTTLRSWRAWLTMAQSLGYGR